MQPAAESQQRCDALPGVPLTVALTSHVTILTGDDCGEDAPPALELTGSDDSAHEELLYRQLVPSRLTIQTKYFMSN